MLKVTLKAFCMGIYLVLFMVACTVNTRIPEVSIPEPLINPIPARVAVVFGEEFRTYEGSIRDISTGINFRSQIGEQNVSLFSQLFISTFTEIEFHNSWESLWDSTEKFDAILEPTVGEFWYDPYRQYTYDSISVYILYRIQMFSPNERLILNWNVESRQTICIQGAALCFDGRDKMFYALFRGVAAKFFAEFQNLPEVNRWIKSISMFSNS
jgi:hypothetical protein